MGWSGREPPSQTDFDFPVKQSQTFTDFFYQQTVTQGSWTASFVHASEWSPTGGNPATATTGFIVDETYSASKPSGAGYAHGWDGGQGGNQPSVYALTVTGLTGTDKVSFHFYGHLTLNLGTATVSLVGPSVNIQKNTSAPWDQYVDFSNGTYTATKSVDLSVVVEKGSPPLLCSANAGSCWYAHPGPGCDTATCCEAVCAIDPTCCSPVWDQDCVTQATNNCAVGAATTAIINPANGHRYQLVSPANWVSGANSYEPTCWDLELPFPGSFGYPVKIENGLENQWVRCNLARGIPGIAAAQDLIISEYFEGANAENRAIELYNPTSVPLNLATGGIQAAGLHRRIGNADRVRPVGHRPLGPELGRRAGERNERDHHRGDRSVPSSVVHLHWQRCGGACEGSDEHPDRRDRPDRLQSGDGMG